MRTCHVLADVSSFRHGLKKALTRVQKALDITSLRLALTRVQKACLAVCKAGLYTHHLMQEQAKKNARLRSKRLFERTSSLMLASPSKKDKCGFVRQPM